MALQAKTCEHILDFDPKIKKTAIAYECEQCVPQGDTWVHLRTCQICGITLCCDSSPNKHASRHYKETEHETIISAEPGENWVWCYKDETFSKYEN